MNQSKVPKLVSTLTNKKNYIVHGRLLEYYLKQGLKIKPIKILFKTMFKINKRILAINDFEVDFFKLMNNSVYGKTMQNVRKRCSFSIVNSEDKALKHISNPSFKNIIKINDNVLIIKIKNKAVLNKPIYVGVEILDFSKLLMYKYHYSLSKNIYNDKIRLLIVILIVCFMK